MVKRFLLVDDDPDVLLLLSANVRAWGQEVATASSLDQARQAISTRAPDVLILDVSMPEMDGPEFLTALRDDGIAPDRVYLLSAIPRERLAQLGDELDVRWITKPFTAPSLRQALADELELDGVG